MSRERTPADDLWDVFLEHFPPLTKSERSMIGKVVRELLECGATPEEANITCLYVRRRFDPVSVMAVAKWHSEAQRDHARVSQPSVLGEVVQLWKSSGESSS